MNQQTTTSADDALPDLRAIDDAAAGAAALREKLADAGTPGYQAEFDPEEAERVGAFVEDALSEEDAAESNADLVDVLGGDDLAPAFIPEDAPTVTDLPTFVDTENVRSLYDWKPGESLDEAIARKKAQEGQPMTMSQQTTTTPDDDALPDLRAIDDAAAGAAALCEKLADALTPGFQVEFDPEEVDGALEPTFLDDEGPSADIPTFITRTNARERFGMEPGETVPEAIARHNAKEV